VPEPRGRPGRDPPHPGRLARSGHAARRDRAVATRRAVQPRRRLVRARVVGGPGGDDGADGRRRHGDARVGPKALAGPAGLPGVERGDLRSDRGVTATRDDTLRSAQPVRDREALRSPDGRHVSRALRAPRELGHPLQPRVAAATARVRHAQGHPRSRGDQPRPGERGASWKPRRDPRLVLRRRRGRGHVADAPAGGRGRLRHRERRRSHRPRPRGDRLRGRRAGSRAPRRRRPGVRSPTRAGRPAG